MLSEETITTSKAYSQGRQEALVDLQKNLVRIKTYGMGAGQGNRYEQILKEECGVTVIAVAGCVVTPDIKNNSRGYNDVVSEFLDKKFKKSVLKEAREKALKEMTEKQEQNPASK